MAPARVPTLFITTGVELLLLKLKTTTEEPLLLAKVVVSVVCAFKVVTVRPHKARRQHAVLNHDFFVVLFFIVVGF